jgi:hypothetical protein
MPLQNISDVVDAELAGQVRYTFWRKAPAVVTVAGAWFDYSMAPGNPSPQYYAAAPLVAQTLSRSGDGGIQHGGAVSPGVKYLRKVTAFAVSAAGVPQRLYLLDYLMFYPFCDMGTPDPQAMDNTQVLTRYTDGEGVKIMPVLVAPHGLVGDTFAVTYTNQDGTAGRVTPLHTMTTAATVNGTLLITQQTGEGRWGPFMALQGNDTGVRSIESVQCTNGTDVGLFTLVLVKPLAEMTVREITAPVEEDFLVDAGLKMPVVEDDAYLNFVTCPNGSLTGIPLQGDATFVWSLD